MSKEEARAIQRKLRHVNRRGAYITLEDGSTECPVLEFPVDSVYVVSADDSVWRILWVGACGDLVRYADSPGGSVHDWPLRKMRVVESVRDKYDGEQIRVLRGVRFGGANEQDMDTVTIRIADPRLVGREHFSEMQRWRRHRATKRNYYERGLKGIIERARRFHPEFDFDYIMS